MSHDIAEGCISRCLLRNRHKNETPSPHAVIRMHDIPAKKKIVRTIKALNEIALLYFAQSKFVLPVYELFACWVIFFMFLSSADFFPQNQLCKI